MDDIFIIVSELLKYKIPSSIKYYDIAKNINVSTSFFDQAINNRNNKHFNLRHIFLIAEFLKIDMSELLPSRENLKIIKNKEITDEEWSRVLEKAYLYSEKDNKNNNNKED